MADLHPQLAEKVSKVLSVMTLLDHPMKIVQGVRSVEEQARLFAQGRTSPGKVVTNCDGVVKKSRHQLAADGFGHAVDCAFVVGGQVVWEGPWNLYGEVGKVLGLVWGGDFHSLVDRPHLELTLIG